MQVGESHIVRPHSELSTQEVIFAMLEAVDECRHFFAGYGMVLLAPLNEPEKNSMYRFLLVIGSIWNRLPPYPISEASVSSSSLTSGSGVLRTAGERNRSIHLLYAGKPVCIRGMGVEVLFI